MRKSITAALAALILLLCGAGGALSDADSAKEEVVYALLTGDGQTRGVYVVNILTPDEHGMLRDYGVYRQDSLRLMNVEGLIEQDGDRVLVTADCERVFYEGEPESAELPWRIQARYTLDGQAITPNELAGASGHMTLTLDIARNPEGSEKLFQALALQVTMLFSGDHATRVEAQGATQANVGADRQLVFTLLPGMGGSLCVEADVRDFEMDAITINGVPIQFSLGFSIGGLKENVDALIDGLIQLEANSGTLALGASGLNTAVVKLNDAIQALPTAPPPSQAADASARLTALREEAASISESIHSLEPGEARDALQASLDARSADIALIEALSGENDALRSAARDMADKLPGIKLQSLVLPYLSQKLSDGAGEYTGGVTALAHALGVPAKEGETPLPRALADSLLPLLEGERALPSFVSERNGLVGLVQFVIKLDGVAKPMPEQQEKAEEPERGFLDRVIDLFTPSSPRQ